MRIWILLGPGLELREKLSAVAFVVRCRVSACDRKKMSEPVQLPKHAHIRTIGAYQLDVAMEIERPNVAGKRISPPLNFSSKSLLAKAEQGPGVIRYYSFRDRD